MNNSNEKWVKILHVPWTKGLNLMPNLVTILYNSDNLRLFYNLIVRLLSQRNCSNKKIYQIKLKIKINPSYIMKLVNFKWSLIKLVDITEFMSNSSTCVIKLYTICKREALVRRKTAISLPSIRNWYIDM